MFTLTHILILSIALVLWAVAILALLVWHRIETKKTNDLFRRLDRLDQGTEELERRIAALR